MELDLTGASTLVDGCMCSAPVSVADGQVVSDRTGRSCDLTGYLVLPGIIDLHGDAFERHVAPRRGAMTQLAEGIHATETEVAANGVTTAVLAQFVSWEGGLRGLEFADQVFCAIRDTRAHLVTDLRPQLRLETHLIELFDEIPERLEAWGVDYVVFNDHLPHDRLAEGRRPPRLVGQALKAGRNPDVHFDYLLALHARSAEVPAALDALCKSLRVRGMQLGSHDDATSTDRATWMARGAQIAEFPETLEASSAARAQGASIVLGAPNLVRGASHKGNISARELVEQGLCDALASDYHYPSLRRAALLLADLGVLELAQSWELVSAGPAKALGLTDRGVLAPGKRADLVILHAETRRVAATMSGGRFSYMSGDIAERLLSA
ncbi:MAG: alpha-D-ribose 1-methylphosphonate 5-triphosphate diphosphatase [Roseobacter sp.]